jgi:hypothetical protein
MSAATISVVVPCYNAGALLQVKVVMNDKAGEHRGVRRPADASRRCIRALRDGPAWGAT